MNPFYNLGNNVRELRLNHQWTQQDLADRVNKTRYNVEIRQQHIGNLESARGERLPSVPVLAALAEVLGTSIDSLLGLDLTEKINPLDGLAKPDQILFMLISRRLKEGKPLNSWSGVSDLATLADSIDLNGGTLEDEFQVILEPTA